MKRYAASSGLRRSAKSVIERLPFGRTVALGAGRRVLRVVATVRMTRAVSAAPPTAATELVAGVPPRRFVTDPKPAPVTDDWPSPPAIDAPFAVVGTRYPDDPGREPVFDIDLFEALNAEYSEHRLVADPPKYDEASMATRARDRVVRVHSSIGLRDRRVLEFGCGAGFEVWLLGHHFGADAWGVDVQKRASWAALAGDRTHLVLADLAVDRPFAGNYFDRVYSFYVFEHVEHPHAALAELYRVMKPGGLAWIAANLHRGPMASHRYRDVHFPFPHLLFGDEVFREFYRRRSGEPQGAAWVNRLTWAEYEDHFERIGFRTKALNFRETPLDEPFYRRFEGVLGRYPKTDLTRDFFEVVLEKPRRPNQPRATRSA